MLFDIKTPFAIISIKVSSEVLCESSPLWEDGIRFSSIITALIKGGFMGDCAKNIRGQ